MALSTDQLLQLPPFKLTDASERAKIMHIAENLDITLDPYLLGEVYSKTPYTPEQQELIVKEMISLFHKVFDGKTPSHAKTYIATAGAPGVGKSIFIENLLAQNISNPKNVVYVDPDRQALRFMDSYKKLSKQKSGEIAYETYRDASNYICNLELVWAIYKGYNIVHGTTSTNDRVAKSILPGLKKLGYEVEIHVLFASAESRKGSLLHRIEVQDFYQSTKADEKGKVAPVYTRIQDAFLQHADRVNIYYNTGTFWLNKTIAQSNKSLRKFAAFNRAIDSSKVVVSANCADILDVLVAEVMQEVPSHDRQQEVIAMFRSWFNGTN